MHRNSAYQIPFYHVEGARGSVFGGEAVEWGVKSNRDILLCVAENWRDVCERRRCRRAGCGVLFWRDVFWKLPSNLHYVILKSITVIDGSVTVRSCITNGIPSHLVMPIVHSPHCLFCPHAYKRTDLYESWALVSD